MWRWKAPSRMCIPDVQHLTEVPGMQAALHRCLTRLGRRREHNQAQPHAVGWACGFFFNQTLIIDPRSAKATYEPHRQVRSPEEQKEYRPSPKNHRQGLSL